MRFSLPPVQGMRVNRSITAHRSPAIPAGETRCLRMAARMPPVEAPTASACARRALIFTHNRVLPNTQYKGNAIQGKITREIDRIHTRFVEVVSRGRNIHPDDAWKLADGDVYDGPEARGKKLIDEVGFLDKVIDDLTETLKLTNPMVIRFVKPPTIRELLTSGSSRLDNPLDIQKQLEKWATTCRVQALWLGR